MSNLTQFFSGGSPSGWPFFLPTLFGSGADGAVTLTTNADVGYLGSYGVKQATNATLAAGQTLTVATGTSTGAFIIGATQTLTIAGSIVANGANGSAGLVDGGGAGGGTAGGGAGAVKVTANGAGVRGSDPTTFGHGSGGYLQASQQQGGGGASGAFENNNGSTNASGGPVTCASFATTSTVVRSINSGTPKFILPSKLITARPSLQGGVSGTSSASGTAIAVNPTTNDIGPWSTVTGTGFLDLQYVPAGAGNFGGGVSGVASQQAAGGGGGGGGGVIILEANTIVLTAGYSITANGGAGGAGYSSNGTTAVAAGGSGGWGGIVILICRTLTGSTAAITASGGAAGAGAGTSNVNGIAGIAGGVYIIKV